MILFASHLFVQIIDKIYKLRKMLYLKLLFIADSGVLKGSEVTLIIGRKSYLHPWLYLVSIDGDTETK